MSAPAWIKILFPADDDTQALRWWRIILTIGLLVGVCVTVYGVAWGTEAEARIEKLEEVVERIDQRLGRMEASADLNLELSLVTAIRGLVETRCRTASPRDVRILEAAIDRHMTEYRNLTGAFFPRPPCPEGTDD